MTDVMIDFETFGNGKNACVVQVGAVYFNRRNGQIQDEFKVNIDAQSCIESGGEFDASTVYWWLSQSPEAIKSILAEPRVDIRKAMMDLNLFLTQADNIWSHATFDFVILTETLKRLGIKPNFRYQAARDIRTLTDLAKLSTKDPQFAREGTHHDALDDCKFQVKYCVAAFNKISCS